MMATARHFPRRAATPDQTGRAGPSSAADRDASNIQTAAASGRSLRSRCNLRRRNLRRRNLRGLRSLRRRSPCPCRCMTIVVSGETYHVTAGQTDTGDIVLNGGTMDVDSGGTANGTTISAGGILNVSHGGVVSGTESQWQ